MDDFLGENYVPRFAFSRLELIEMIEKAIDVGIFIDVKYVEKMPKGFLSGHTSRLVDSAISDVINKNATKE